jgi:hypothetical protein
LTSLTYCAMIGTAMVEITIHIDQFARRTGRVVSIYHRSPEGASCFLDME